MGVMIKGLEMPKNCLGCSTKCDPENRKCNIDGHVFEETFTVVTSRRDKDCPLVETDNEPITKNDLPHCQHTDEEIAKSFIKDVEAVKDQLPCGEQMGFPSTFDEFAKDYGFRDKEEIYTNGSELIPVFRVKQWLEHISTTKSVTPRGSCEPMTKTLGIELMHNPSELVELLEEQYKKGEVSPIVISESLITLFRMLGEKNRPQS